MSERAERLVMSRQASFHGYWALIANRLSLYAARRER